MTRRGADAVAVLAALLLDASNAWAHPEGATAGLAAGLLHPVSGLDHLLAMLEVGILSVSLGGVAIWQVPLAFVSAMAAGGVLGFVGCPLPMAERGVAGSVVLLGVAIGWRREPEHLRLGFVCIALFGICHGYAHGVELPRAASPLFYATGFLVTTILIHVVGIFIGELASESTRRLRGLRSLGWLLAGAGGWLILRAHL